MDEYEPITGELREAVMANGGIATLDGCIIKEYMTIAKSELDDLCDNIDSVHTQLERDFDRVKAERDSMAAALDAAQGEHAFAPESHYVMLPKDADGVPIHVGDMMERGNVRGHVIALMLCEYPKKWSGELHWAVQLEGEQAPTALDAFFHHYHEPTVEDVLSEMLEQAFPSDFMHRSEAIEAMVAEYAAKLRLADGKEQQ